MLCSEFDGFSIADITEYLQGIGVHIDIHGIPYPPPFLSVKKDPSSPAKEPICTEYFARIVE